jgi:sialic acid synthase SpsE
MIQIGKIKVGEGCPVLYIAEVACEHQGSLEISKSIVKAVADIQNATGAELVVKFQLHIAENEFVPGTIKFWAGDMDSVLKAVNLEPPEKHVELMRFCEKMGVQYLCTPFDTKTAYVLHKLGCPAFKVGSGELTNHPTHRFLAKICATEGKAVIFSTGMSTLDEIDETVQIYREAGATNWAITNCDSVYPATYSDVHLGMIKVLRDHYGDVIIGHSDHTPTIYTALGAVALGARIVEKHVTIHKRLHGPDVAVSLELQEFEELVRAGMGIEAALGACKNVAPKEQIVRDWAGHFVVTEVEIAAGTIITADMISEKRSGGLGKIPAKKLESLYGRRAARDLPRHYFLESEDLENV